MKQLFLLIFSLLVIGNVAFAGTPQRVAVVIVGTSDFKTQDFFEYFQNQLSDETDTSYKIITGNEPQNKWTDYWIEKGFLEEQTPQNKDDLIGFTKTSGYDKVLFFLVKDAVTEKQARTWIFDKWEQSRTSVTTNAFLCTTEKVIRTYSVTKQDDSEWSEMRAKRGALEKCAHDTGKEMKYYFGKTAFF